MEKELYLSDFEMFDGEDCMEDSEIFENKEDAMKDMQQLIEDYRPFWENFNIIENTPDYFCAYDEGFYDNAHIEIVITKKSVN